MTSRTSICLKLGKHFSPRTLESVFPIYTPTKVTVNFNKRVVCIISNLCFNGNANFICKNSKLEVFDHVIVKTMGRI